VTLSQDSRPSDVNETPPPLDAFPDLSNWRAAGMHDAVFHSTTAGGGTVYVRADDGSAPTLRRLADQAGVPAPRVLGHREGWLVLEALPGVPLNDDRWLERPDAAVPIIADALLRLARNDVRHGDMCLPNILGDLEKNELSGIVDWGDAGRFDPIIDVASAIWSCEYNGYSPEVPVAVLEAMGWPRADSAEVARLSRIWMDLEGPPD
jgi:aminoglycoside phosphotransferase